MWYAGAIRIIIYLYTWSNILFGFGRAYAALTYLLVFIIAIFNIIICIIMELTRMNINNRDADTNDSILDKL